MDKVSGATFHLYKEYQTADEEDLGTRITEGGTASWEGLLWGSYTLIEDKPADGYVAVETIRNFKIDADCLEMKYTGGQAIKNPPIQGWFKLEKRDKATNQVIPKVEFKLFKVNLKDYKLITNEKGILEDQNGNTQIGPLRSGAYYLEEVTPEGYEPLDKQISFKIEYDNQLEEFTVDRAVRNTPVLGSVLLYKVDEDKNPLKGATFKLYATKPRNIGDSFATLINKDHVYEYGEYVTNDNGAIKVTDLPWDDYFFVETQAPKGYEILEKDKTYDFTINAQNSKDTIPIGPIGNRKLTGTVGLKKIDSDNNKALQGAEFKLYMRTADGGAIDVSPDYNAINGVFVTDANGETKVDNVKWGTYFFDETKAPEGYEPISETNRVTSRDLIVNERNYDETAKIMQPQIDDMVRNVKGYGHVRLIKKFTQEVSGSLAGIRFDLHSDKWSDVKPLYTDENGKIEASIIGDLEYGHYWFTEESVPVELNCPVSDFELHFTIDRSNPESDPIEYEFVNSPVYASAKIIKVNPYVYVEGQQGSEGTIDGIRFGVFTADGKPVTEVTSKNGGVVEVNHLPMGEYYFLENADSAAEAGYVASTDKYEFTIGPDDGVAAGQPEKYVDVYKEGDKINAVSTVPNPPVKGSIRLIKLGTSMDGSSKDIDISDALFELYKETEGLIMTSDELAPLNNGKEIVVTGLEWGKYYFKEIKAPKGYALPEGDKVYSTVAEIGANNVFESVGSPITCEINDETIRVFISKRSLFGAEELPGAKMSLYAADDQDNRTGSPILEWVSTSVPKVIEVGGDLKEGVVAGRHYVIHEEAAPAGYAFAKDIPFSVNEDGSINANTYSTRLEGSGNGMTIIVDDPPLLVHISKRELGTNVELSGAKLQIKDKDDNVIEAWTCTGDDHKVKAVLSVGEIYTLEETDPPKGYYTAEPITFTITENGFIDILKDASASATLEAKSPSLAGTGLSAVVSTLVMYDRPVRVEISKKRLSGSDTDYVQGAELALYEKDGEDYKQIAAWVSSGDKPYVVEYGLLKVGGSYKVVETSVPKGYVKAKDLYFTVKDTNEFVKTNGDGLFVQKEVMYDPSVNVKISKKSSTGEDELPGATLKVVDSQGNDVVSFVSGSRQTLITSIKSVDALSADEKAAFADYNVIYDVKLETGKSYKLKEVSAPAGYALAEDVEFKIDENGNQVPAPVVMRDKPLEISLSKKDIADGSYLEGATLEFKNAAGEVVAEWVSSDKPILITLRKVSETEAAKYAQVIEKALPAGDYVLHEVKAPVGYKTAPDINITITGADVKKADGSVREESMYDYKEGKLKIFGTKEWIVPKDSSGNVSSEFTYPDLTIELYRDSVTQGELDAKPIKSIVLKNGTANYAFGDLERYRTDDGKNYEYTYKVIEKLPKEAEDDYKCIELEMKKTEDGIEANYTVGFINTLSQRYVTLPVTKTFVLFKDKDGKALNDVKYDTVTIWLLQNGKRVDIDGDGKEESVTIENGAKDQGGKAVFKFVDLPEYDLTTGNAYEYTVEETGAEGYDSKVVYKDGAAEIFNTPKQSPFYIKGIKTWIDPDGTKRPDVTMQLFRDGKLYKETKLSADNTFSFGPLYEYNFGWGNEEGDMKDTADGHRFLYEIKETGAVGYEVTVIGSGTEMVIKDAVAEVKVTNKLAQEYVEKSGNKYWNDNGDSSKRPPVTIYLYATDSTGRKDEFVDSYVIPNTSSRYEFGTKGRKQLPKYDANGKEISYRVEETEIPGYASVKQGDDFINTPSKTVISKIDAATNAELPGAVLALTKKGSKKEVERWTSTSKPHYIEGLEIGAEYTLTEISAPKGYVLASPVTFKVASDGVEQKVVMVDDPVIGEVVLTKLDAATREKLSGAKFNLYTSDGKAIKTVGSTGSYNYTENSSGSAELTVGSDGTLKVGELPYGAYYFKEVKAPDGYELSSETVSFTIAEKDAKATVTFLNESRKGSATLLKTNADGSRALAGAVFELYSKTPSSTGQAAASTVFSDAYYRYGTYTTDSNGRIEVTGLPWDDYYFIEVQAPEGYQINRDVTGDPLVYTFSVTADNAGGSAIRVATVANEEITEEGGVLGARVPEKASGVLGVRSAPKKGVLGTRVGPATGDVSAIALWLALLLACVGTIIWLVTDAKRKRSTDK